MTHRSIGFIGKMGSGKSTAADVLINTHGYVPVSFAAPLKAMVIEADPLVGYRPELGRYSPVMLHLSDLLSSGKTFEECKREYPEVRRSLQRIGQGVRNIDPDYWVRLALNEIISLPRAPVVIADVRYPNEADTLRKNGFVLVRITRPAIAAGGMTMDETRAALHDSETALNGYAADATIVNGGTRNELIDAVLNLL